MGTPGSADLGDNPVVLVVEDSGGLKDSQSFTIVVSPPVLKYIYLPVILR